jgi:hypothetical protein
MLRNSGIRFERVCSRRIKTREADGKKARHGGVRKIGKK